MQNITQQVINQDIKHSTRQKYPKPLPHWYSNTLFLDIFQQNKTTEVTNKTNKTHTSMGVSINDTQPNYNHTKTKYQDNTKQKKI